MKFVKKYLIHAPIHDVWQALVDPKKINEWGGGPVVMDAKAGTKFSLWGGDIHGTNVKVISEKKLVQEWFGGDWPKPSDLTFFLVQNGDTTTVTLSQTDIPDNEFNDIAQGWDDYYMEPLKSLLESK